MLQTETSLRGSLEPVVNDFLEINSEALRHKKEVGGGFFLAYEDLGVRLLRNDSQPSGFLL